MKKKFEQFSISETVSFSIESGAFIFPEFQRMINAGWKPRSVDLNPKAFAVNEENLILTLTALLEREI